MGRKLCSDEVHWMFLIVLLLAALGTCFIVLFFPTVAIVFSAMVFIVSIYYFFRYRNHQSGISFAILIITILLSLFPFWEYVQLSRVYGWENVDSWREIARQHNEGVHQFDCPLTDDPEDLCRYKDVYRDDDNVEDLYREVEEIGLEYIQ